MTFDLLQTLADLLGVGRDQLWPILARKTSRLLLIWFTAWIMFRLLRLMSKRIIASVDDRDDSRLTTQEKRGITIAQLVRSVGKVVILVLTVMLSLAEFIDIGPLLAGAGIFGLAFSLGAQSLVRDVISGFFILVDNQLAVGDSVQIAGKSGVVERITLRLVQLRDVDGVVHIVPCGKIETVTNETTGWSRAVVDVEVGSDPDIDRVLGIFREEAQALANDPEWAPLFDRMPEVVGIEHLDGNKVTVRTQLRTTPGQQGVVGSEFRRRLKNRLARERIPMTFPAGSVHVRTLPQAPSEPSGGLR